MASLYNCRGLITEGVHRLYLERAPCGLECDTETDPQIGVPGALTVLGPKFYDKQRSVIIEQDGIAALPGVQEKFR